VYVVVLLYANQVVFVKNLVFEEWNIYALVSMMCSSISLTLLIFFLSAVFRFREDIQREEPNFFSNLYEAYKARYDKYKAMVENAEINPVQEFRHLVAEAAQRAAKTAQSAEQFSVKSAQNMYETIIQPGSNMDKQLSAFSHATSIQLAETATFLSEQRKALMQQLRGNRAMLTRMREMSYAVNSKQMAALMRKITECYDALERTEIRAKDAFLNATGRLTDNPLFNQPQQEPKRFAKYNSDPLLGIATYPLGFHLLVLGGTEISLRILLKRRGFERRFVGPVAYWHHPGPDSDALDDSGISSSNFFMPKRESPKKLPIVFIHGIGVGLISYIPLIDLLLMEGRPILMPEIPYVSGFRPWQGPNSVLSPAVVASTVSTDILNSNWQTLTRSGRGIKSNRKHFEISHPQPHKHSPLASFHPDCVFR
jgi:hypothetical protein